MTLGKFTVGADPELFLTTRDGAAVSAIGLIGGSKRNPRPIGEGCSLQEDNVAVEFNIAPASTVDEFVKSCEYALSKIMDEMAEKDLFPNLSAAVVFPEAELMHPRARTFGCDPDMNVWTGTKNPSPKATNPNLRSAGGHIHIGSDLSKTQLVKWCDAIIGLASVCEDSDTARRELYGKAGAYRPKSYGVEYRTPSNYWLKRQSWMKAVFHRVGEVVRMVEQGYTLDEKDGIDIQNAINQSDMKHADRLMANYANLFGVRYDA